MTNLRASIILLLPALLAALLQPSSPAQTPSPAPQPKGTIYEPQLPPLSNDYPATADSKTQPGVPVGKTFKFTLDDSKIFPDTTRTITVYIPAAYNPKKPACLYVGFNSLGYDAPIVFDNLISQHAIPVIIGIGVAPGEVKPSDPSATQRYDRSFELDSLTDKLARFILEEVIPAVEAHKTPSGDPIRISTDPSDHMIAGGSTGGIAAFNVAWQRPDAFRRVFMNIGTFVGMRTGEQFYVQVRKTEPKPIRVFTTDGAHDEWPGGPEMGDWFMSNLTMNRALEFAGYDVQHVWGDHAHNGNLGTQLFPAAMKWLWRDYPTPIQALNPGDSKFEDPTQPPGNPRLKDIAIPGETWQLTTDHPTFPTAFKTSTGDTYSVTPTPNGEAELWLTRANGQKLKLDDHILGAAGLAITPDGAWLTVPQSHSRLGLSYRIKPDGTVDARETLFDFYVPADADDSGAAAIAYDTNGHAYVATRLGIQVFDRNGRVTVILPLPANEHATSLTFGGSDFSTLYVATATGKIYKRKMKVPGLPPAAPPIKLKPEGAG